MKSFLKNYTIGAAVLLVSLVTIYNLGNRPKTVTLSEDRWACGDTVPRGIEAFCTNFVYKPTINEKLAAKTP